MEEYIKEKIKLYSCMPENVYNEITNKNLEFADRESRLQNRVILPVPISHYESIVVVNKYGNWTLYTNNVNSPNVKQVVNYLANLRSRVQDDWHVMSSAHCVVYDGKILKNRWGDKWDDAEYYANKVGIISDIADTLIKNG